MKRNNFNKVIGKEHWVLLYFLFYIGGNKKSKTTTLDHGDGTQTDVLLG